MKKIPLTQGKFALVDDEDFEYLNQWKWIFHKNKKDRTGYAIRSGYNKTTGKRTRIAMHRVLIKAVHPQICDHKNGNGLDNRKANLRLCDRFESVWNRKTFSRKKTPAIKGVTKVKDKKGIPAYWIARITYKGTRIYLGTFKTKKAAESAYKKRATELHKEFAKW